MNGLPHPDITVDVDLRNPGQFFACCGLFELASRLWPGSEGWFTEVDGPSAFQVSTGSGHNDPLREIIDTLVAEGALVELATDHEHYAGDRKPIVLREPYKLRLDWWLDSYRGRDKSELKVWAGQMTPRGNLSMLQSKLRDVVKAGKEPAGFKNLFTARVSASGMGIDPATSWTAINVGFSPDEQSLEVLTAPATEILAAIGLQRFRPVWDKTKRGRWFIYHVWVTRLEANIAPAALSGAAGHSTAAYTFPVEMRNSQYGNFGRAKPWESEG